MIHVFQQAFKVLTLFTYVNMLFTKLMIVYSWDFVNSAAYISENERRSKGESC
jgi:hypothetical protein